MGFLLKKKGRKQHFNLPHFGRVSEVSKSPPRLCLLKDCNHSCCSAIYLVYSSEINDYPTYIPEGHLQQYALKNERLKTADRTKGVWEPTEKVKECLLVLRSISREDAAPIQPSMPPHHPSVEGVRVR